MLNPNPHAEFPPTTWGLFIRSASESPEELLARMTKLADRYWQPVYAFLFRHHTLPGEDARDLTQEFFVLLLETPLLDRYEPERGRFRAFVKTALRRFVVDRRREQSRQKRGGDARVISLPPADEIDVCAPEPGEPDDAFFDRVWMERVLDDSLEDVRHFFADLGHDDAMRIYEMYYLVEPDKRPTYEEIARTLGVTAKHVDNDLTEVRRKIREAISARVRDTTSTPDDYVRELELYFRGAP